MKNIITIIVIILSLVAVPFVMAKTSNANANNIQQVPRLTLSQRFAILKSTELSMKTWMTSSIQALKLKQSKIK